MKLKALLAQNKRAVLERWRHLIFQTYSPHAQRMLQSGIDRFRNPVGDAIRRETERAFEILLKGSSAPPASGLFEDVVKIRSVQDFSASQAITFVFSLKQAIREQLSDQLGENGMATELLAFESRIDELALQVFESYVSCREKIHDIRTSELRNRISHLQRCLDPVRNGVGLQRCKATDSEVVNKR
jgi:hypothetical protein